MAGTHHDLRKPSDRRLATLRKIRRSVRIFALMGIILFPFGIVFWTGSEIASPPRRALMDYHRLILADPESHGIRLDRFTASDGTPCLVVSPAGNPGHRGALIRQQLGGRGFALPAFGHIGGTLVLTHGRRGRKEDYLPIAERLCAAGFRCVIPDLPAHGDHPGTIATYGVREAGLPARMLDEAASKFGFEKHPAGLLGMSMGGSVAVHAANQADAPWKALVVISSFDSFAPVIVGQATRHAGQTLGALWAKGTDAVYQWKSGISIHAIRPRFHAGSVRVPVLVAHGTADPVVPMDSGKRLFNSLPQESAKQWVEIPGAGHDNVLITAYPIYADIAEWMLRHVAGGQGVR